MDTISLPKVYFITGAGISAESGVPTFRGENGLWNDFDIDEICNIHTFKQNHDKVNQFYRQYYDMLKNIEPNHAHRIIGKLQQRYGSDRVKVITTNVDDLHERGGATDVLHVHGDIRYKIQDFFGDSKVVPVECDDPVTEGTYSKPAVVFFGESVRYTSDGVKHQLYDELYETLDNINSHDIVIVIGASFQVVPFHYLLGSCPAYKININIEDDCFTNSCFNSVLVDGATLGLQKCKNFIETTMEGKNV